MKYSITRRFQFCAGHRVYKHESKCKNVHGHNYVLYYTVTAPKLDELGRVIDFSVIKKHIGDWIDEFWDHNFILNKDDTKLIKILEPFCKNGEAYLMDGNPTAENMAKKLYDIGFNLLPNPIKPLKVVLHETENCSATYPES